MQNKKSIKKASVNKNTGNTLQGEIKIEHKEKSILKPFAFFALFVICVGSAMLYPYMTQKPSFSLSTPQKPYLKKDVPAKKIIETAIIEEKVELPVQKNKIEEEKAQALNDETVLLQKKTIDELNEKIHQLEIENLNLKEQTNSSENLIPLTVQLIEEIHTGEAFGTTLKSLLTQDINNSFALMIQKRLGNYATTGLPTAEKLKKQFYARLKMTQDSFYTSPKNASWNQKSANFFKSLFHIYPLQINPNEANGEELLFLAKQQVDSQNFKGAVLSIEKMPSSSKQFLMDFVQNAQHYIEAQQIIKEYLNSERK